MILPNLIRIFSSSIQLSHACIIAQWFKGWNTKHHSNMYKTSFSMPYDDTSFNTLTNLGSCCLFQFSEDVLFVCTSTAKANFWRWCKFCSINRIHSMLLMIRVVKCPQAVKSDREILYATWVQADKHYIDQ